MCGYERFVYLKCGHQTAQLKTDEGRLIGEKFYIKDANALKKHENWLKRERECCYRPSPNAKPLGGVCCKLQGCSGAGDKKRPTVTSPGPLNFRTPSKGQSKKKSKAKSHVKGGETESLGSSSGPEEIEESEETEEGEDWVSQQAEISQRADGLAAARAPSLASQKLTLAGDSGQGETMAHAIAKSQRHGAFGSSRASSDSDKVVDTDESSSKALSIRGASRTNSNGNEKNLPQTISRPQSVSGKSIVSTVHSERSKKSEPPSESRYSKFNEKHQSSRSSRAESLSGRSTASTVDSKNSTTSRASTKSRKTRILDETMDDRASDAASVRSVESGLSTRTLKPRNNSESPRLIIPAASQSRGNDDSASIRSTSSRTSRSSRSSKHSDTMSICSERSYRSQLSGDGASSGMSYIAEEPYNEDFLSNGYGYQ